MARTASFNKKLAKIAATKAEALGANVTFVDLRDYPMPLYDGDDEDASGLPPNALAFKALMVANDAFIIACPEYNSAITPLLKNTIDWCSRAHREKEPPLECYDGKVVGLLGTSPGGLGAMRVLPTVRALLQNIRCMVLPTFVAIPNAFTVFDEGGNIKDESIDARVDALVRAVVDTASKLA